MGLRAGALFGGVFFFWISGTRVIDPRQFEWLMKLDWRINFLGWHLFRNDPWHIPPGLIDGYLAGEGTTIGFTDSVPLVALLLKPFDAVLPTPFQYFGIWLLVCFILQGFFGALLTRIFTRSAVLQSLGAALFVLVPTLLMRVGHPALTAHFLLLWALWLYLASQREHRAPQLSQLPLGFVAGLTHPYMAGMTLAMLASIPLRDRTSPSWRAFAGAVGAAILAWWMAGFISVSSTTDLAAGGLGLYSMNILSPITPLGWSTLFPELPVAHEMQAYEGFQYLGAGIIALSVAHVGVATVRRRQTQAAFGWPIVAICALCAVYALSPRITFGNAVIVDWTNPTIDRLAFFRASGRFFWPMTYLLVTAAIASISQLRFRFAAPILALAIAVQFVDLRNAHAERRTTSRSEAFHTWPRQLTSPAWAAILPHYEHIVLVPASQCGGAPIAHEEPAYLAGLYGLTVNSGLGARWDDSRRRRYCGDLEVIVAKGDIDDQSLYIVTDRHEAQLRAASTSPVVCGTLDGVRVCATAASSSAWRDRVQMSE
jgi:hypothetical protein